ncbi:DUF5677 domain-containing protein [Pseudomonas aeruginosa]|uniref:DUF5677 domain-containing protein n=1 Tax=Pseudomonas aeruginosa TaxID=287 RepID=UPI00195F1778|nr:hypothetical protein [Pseudomonas aeruginosa]
MDILQKALDKIVCEYAQEADGDEALEALEEALKNSYIEILASTPIKVLDSIKKAAADGGLEERRNLHKGFVERNYTRWKEGFDSLEVLIEICSEAGESNAQRLGSNELIHDNRYGALMRLHAKGCLVAREIFCLLLNGFADGAHARWRALHELSVTTMFLGRCDEGTVEKYFLHECVESYKGALMHRKYEDRLQAKGVNDEELAELKALHDSVVEKYGQDFKNSYGWAEAFLNKKRVNFLDIEEYVGLDHWRPYYKWASQNIHATAKTLTCSLGMVEAKEEGLLAGPSNSGLTDPAHSMAISLVQLTTVLLSVDPNLDDLVSMNMIKTLIDEIGDAFLRGAGLA